MSIQQLPENVIAQIKSSTTVTSLNAVVCGLVKNSLDAQATKITISIDYVRGNCSVEDNGLGIPPNEFKPTGGLGKLHYTSKFPATRNDIHGRNGTFLASVAALSLLSITSHHHGYHSHNSIKIHNAEVIARHTPSLPEQRLLSFPHGTRTTVRDLFGSMPVRVKQRAIDAERGVNAKDWERLKRVLVALLLAWPGRVSLSVRDSVDRRSLAIRIPEESSILQDKKDDVLSFTTRVSRTLFQAQLSDDSSRDAWVPLKAAVGQISIVGAVSLVPIASRQVQFISIGVRPVSNDFGSNVLYEEINRLFANSSFGVREEGGDLDDDEKIRRAKDRRFRTDGFTTQELRGRKGADRWPMFYIRINHAGLNSRLAGYDMEEDFDEQHESLRGIIDLLTAAIHEFLKAHHFRPRHSGPSRSASLTHLSTGDGRKKSSSGSSTPKAGSGTERACTPRSHLSSGDLASTRLNLAPDAIRLRPESPFDSWMRVKSGQPQYAHLHEKLLDQDVVIGSRDDQIQPIRTSSCSSRSDNLLETPLVAPDGTLLRAPFADVETDTCGNSQELIPEEKNPDREPPQLQKNDEVLWTNPTTKETFVVSARTGLVIRPVRRADATEVLGDNHHLYSRKKLRTNTKPVSRDERSEWLGDLLSSWHNPVFQPQEPPIPVAFDEEKAFDLMTGASGNAYHQCNSKILNALQPFRSVESRLSKDNLRNAQVIAQVDRKFILAKVSLLLPPANGTTKGEDASSLIIIDQHAADERCRVESLIKDYFVVAKDTQDMPTVFAQAELLEKPIIFDISARDCRQFERSTGYFRHWGIVFQVDSAPKSETISKRGAQLKISKLPPSIIERCRLEPRLLIELLRKEAWKFDEQGSSVSQHGMNEAIQDGERNTDGLHWLARFHGCPQGILEMINSRACRSSIMFNDHLSHEECVNLVRRLADCALPFQCAHGRPSMVPLTDLGNSPMGTADTGESTRGFAEEFKRWKAGMNG
ncbi:DNA mismatch repair protein [Parahypoxylon ruwenzoriense]